MKIFTKNKMLVLALSITNIFCYGQQNRSAVCQLGEIKNDSILPYIQSLQIDCGTKDLRSFSEKTEKLISLKSIVLNGDTSPKEWSDLFKEIKSKPLVKEITFSGNKFGSLPFGYENLVSVERLSFIDNDSLDYAELIGQLATLPNLKDLTLDIATIFDLPTNFNDLKNIQNITLINTDENISKNDVDLFSTQKEPITYDYYIDKGDKKFASLKYTAIAGEIDSDEYKELSKRFTTSIDFNETPAAFKPKYANVKPPIKGIDVERTNYTINPTIENIITYPSGTKILIPAKAFTNNDGTPITGSVTLSYREFRDPVDILVSGIPMKYDTAGKVTNFESAGMFELLASSKNEPLSVAKDKNIQMNFATTSKDSTYNFYAFDDKKGNWDYLNKPKNVTSKTIIQLKTPSSAYQVYKSYTTNRKRIYDKTPFNERFYDSIYVYTNRKENSGNRISYRAGGRSRSRSMYSLVKINNVKKTKEGTILFKVNSFNTSHPEMSEFNNVYFALNEVMSQAEFKQKYSRRKIYNDIRVIFSGNDVELKLKDNSSIKNISASLVTIDNKGKEQEIKNISARMKRYNRRLNAREKRFNSDLVKGKIYINEIQIKDLNKLSLYAFNEAKKSMNEDEKKMTLKEWEDYCKQIDKNKAEWDKQSDEIKMSQLTKAEATSSNLIQSLSLGGTGIYNCDHIQCLKDPVEIFASYKAANNENLNPQSAYILDKRSNSVTRFDGSEDSGPDRIGFSKSSKAENTLLAVNKDGSLAIYKTEGFKKNKFTNNGNFDFVVTKIDSKLTSVGDLKTIIGF